MLGILSLEPNWGNKLSVLGLSLRRLLSTTTMKKLSQVVNAPNSQFQSILQHSRYLQQLEQQLFVILPAPLRPHCHVANLNADSLVLYTHSAAWATRLRYLQTLILTQARQLTGLNLSRIEVRVQPDSAMPATTAQHASPALTRTLSSENAHLLRTVAETVKHPRLRNALLNLIQHQTTEAG